MPHFLVDDSMPFHAKIVAAGNAAIGLWTRAGAWSNQQANLTEGFIPEHMARTMGTPAQIKRLVATKLWHQVTGGYQFHEWLGPGRQRSRETILDHQRKRAEAGRIGGQRSGQTRRRTGQHGRSESEADAEAFASPDAAPPLPPQPVDNANAPQFRGPPDTTEKSANFGREPSPPAQMR
ncbi:hypothetical protein BJY24_007854, partial [Nocardia transvalensis]|nr:hypothetical protein [Nocardia transvalensis]